MKPKSPSLQADSLPTELTRETLLNFSVKPEAFSQGVSFAGNVSLSVSLSTPLNFKSQLKCYSLKEISLTPGLSQFSLYIIKHSLLYLPHMSCFPHTNLEAPQ